MTVTLAPVTRDNVRAICEMKLAQDQVQLVAPPAFTVAEGHYEPGSLLRAICVEGEPVGVLLVELEGVVPNLVRFMVDRERQRRGVGARALGLLVDELAALGHDTVETSFVPLAGGAGGFWRAQGFRDPGRVRHGEPVHVRGPRVVRLADPGEPEAVAVLAGYWRDIVGRYFGREATDADVADAFRDYPSDHLAALGGLFLLARDEHGPVGSAGLRWRDDGDAELARMAVLPRGRHRGWGRRLLAVAEEQAREHGSPAIRLEVRGDLVEAQALYAECGYVEVPAFSDAKHADVWFRKALSSR